MIFSGLQYCFLSWPGYSNVHNLYANVCICIVQSEKQLCPPSILSGVLCVGRLAWGRGSHTFHVQYLREKGWCNNEERKGENEPHSIVHYSGCAVLKKEEQLIHEPNFFCV